MFADLLDTFAAPFQSLASLLITFVCVGGLTIVMNLFPIVIAVNRRHPNTLPISLESLPLGWTCVGWIAALAWSVAVFEPSPT